MAPPPGPKGRTRGRSCHCPASAHGPYRTGSRRLEPGEWRAGCRRQPHRVLRSCRNRTSAEWREMSASANLERNWDGFSAASREGAMLYLAAKALLSGLIVAAVSEIAKRSPGLGAMILSLPLVSILAFILLWLGC